MKKFYFGYDIDNVRLVEEYVRKKYSTNLYIIHKGYGDDVMNALDIKSSNDIGLKELIMNCEGEGDYWE
jgi:hypothetical protein|tara:strand:- start:455 stop:661 length:207 start_codon:yes stop_codon:yes gene_type:complete